MFKWNCCSHEVTLFSDPTNRKAIKSCLETKVHRIIPIGETVELQNTISISNVKINKICKYRYTYIWKWIYAPYYYWIIRVDKNVV